MLLIILLISLFYYNRIPKINMMETEEKCNFMSSRGIMRSCNIYSNKPMIKSSIKKLIGYDFTKGFEGCSIYICTSAIPVFVNEIDKIKYRFILVTGDADESCPVDLFTNDTFNSFIENYKIIHWYAQNCVIKHKKMTQLPIGLDYHTMSNNNHHKWGNYQTPMKQEIVLSGISNNSLPFWERKLKCYSNFHFNINSYDRGDAINSIDKNLVDYETHQIKRDETWNKMTSYCFIISPHGNGLDCHRTWEALHLGCIPIVKKSSLDNMYDNLPVLIVNEWSDININLLNSTINKFRNIKDNFDYDKLRLEHWVSKIKYNIL